MSLVCQQISVFGSTSQAIFTVVRCFLLKERFEPYQMLASEFHWRLAVIGFDNDDDFHHDGTWIGLLSGGL